ncbi:hypothetical protein, partial [Pseudarthrobacter cellobiosi]|uniref:hypothetical protein n=1 Tax=Pseudarthrobacter cellobiosi TaxID=2953654 RepID=UPI00208EAA22
MTIIQNSLFSALAPELSTGVAGTPAGDSLASIHRSAWADELNSVSARCAGEGRAGVPGLA